MTPETQKSTPPLVRGKCYLLTEDDNDKPALREIGTDTLFVYETVEDRNVALIALYKRLQN